MEWYTHDKGRELLRHVRKRDWDVHEQNKRFCLSPKNVGCKTLSENAGSITSMHFIPMTSPI
jgi:hypothetical protein